MSLPRNYPPMIPSMTLRVGLVHMGQVKAERMAEAGRPLTFGSGRCDLVIPGLPRRQILFEPRGEGFVLLARPGMTGRVALESGVFDLEGAPAEPRGALRAVRLDEKSRGKVEIGEWTVLFQFVATPLVAARPAADFRPRLLGETDHTFVGFLSAFSAAAVALLSVAANTPIPDEVDVSMAPERIIEQILLATVPLPTPVVEERAAPDPRAATARAARRASRVEDRVERRANRAEDNRTVGERLAASPLMAGILGTHGAPGRNDMFSGADTMAGAVNEALQRVVGDDQASQGGLSLRSGAGGRDDVGIGALGRSGGGGAHIGGPEAGRAPVARADVNLKLPTSADPKGLGDLQRRVKTYAGAVQGCYEQALREDPELSGRVVLSLSLSAGRVSEAVVVENSTGSQELAICVESRAERWQFDTSVTLDFSVPFALTRG